jgi:hypothetical protein
MVSDVNGMVSQYMKSRLFIRKGHAATPVEFCCSTWTGYFGRALQIIKVQYLETNAVAKENRLLLRI